MMHLSRPHFPPELSPFSGEVDADVHEVSRDIRDRPEESHGLCRFGSKLDGKFGWKHDIAESALAGHANSMDYVWNQPERRDLYLAARILANGQQDGDWRQWACDTLIQDLELYDDPCQGAASWLAEDEIQLANELGKCLREVVQQNPFRAADLLGEATPSLQAIARKLAARIETNGRKIALPSVWIGTGRPFRVENGHRVSGITAKQRAAS